METDGIRPFSENDLAATSDFDSTAAGRKSQFLLVPPKITGSAFCRSTYVSLA
jgi:hypothetical protein